MRIVQNNVPISPAMDVSCSHCNSVFRVDKGEGKWLKPYSDCELDSWLVYCPVCNNAQSYPKTIEREKTFWERLFTSGNGAML